MLNGALLAFEESAELWDGYRIEPVVADPQGDNRLYAEYVNGFLDEGIRHVVGCYTSSSRKEVIPHFEKRDALLWYPSHYEGFESSSNVVYTGAAPNQHILPLIDYCFSRFGKRVFCVGSNYIWAWENNRIMREGALGCGGAVLAERYYPVGETDFAKVIDEILISRPDFVFNTVIGTSAYTFFREFRAACKARGIRQPAEIPVASCSLSEPELREIGEGALDGHISSSVYFSTIKTAQNAQFIARYADAFPDGPAASADAEASYVAVKLLVMALARAGSDASDAVKAALAGCGIDAPQGHVRIDPENWHAWLTPRIGLSNARGEFDVVFEATETVAPDPYLVNTAPRYASDSKPRNLRVV